MSPAPPRVVVRRGSTPYGYDRTVARLGLAPVAGADEAGRGACAGPLVVAAVVLPLSRGSEIDELADSKLLVPATRERVLARIERTALAISVVVVDAAEVDRRGVHRANVEAMRRAVARLDVRPGYVLTDGFPVAGIGSPGLAVWKGDRVSANVAAASVVAKVTRDRLMVELDRLWPGYGFAEHKGYSTPQHQQALSGRGPCPQHRRSYANVSRVLGGEVPVQTWEETA
jgi:ribonuclease HII